MTAGLPGAGIGGLFYMLSAIGMPFHAAFRSVRRKLSDRGETDPPVNWRLVMRQFAIAVGILAALWVTGWLLALVIQAYPDSLGAMKPPGGGHHVPNVLKIGALVLSLGTLSLVLIAVQVARLIVNRRSDDVARVATLIALLMGLLVLPAHAQPTTGSASASVSAHLRTAESAYNAGDTELAKSEYSAVLSVDPNNPRALFRLGQLTRSDPNRALPLFRRYVAVVPDDAWGHIALGDELALAGNFSDAIREYDEASRLAPTQRDVWIGRARVLARAGRTDDAIATLEKWTRSHPDDAEALRDFGDQLRRAGRLSEAAVAYRMSVAREADPRTARRLDAVRATIAPAVEVITTGAGDSDQNRSYRIGASASSAIGDRARLVLSGGWKRITGFTEATVRDASLGFSARPTASFRIEGAAGGLQSSSDTTGLVTATAAATSLARATDVRLSLVPGRGRGNGGNAAAPPPGTVIHVEQPTERTIAVGSARAVWKQPGSFGMLCLGGCAWAERLLRTTPTPSDNGRFC